ncbi:MAG: DUF6588 family protein [Candidatus Neomarinimicrobiota bacterium]
MVKTLNRIVMVALLLVATIVAQEFSMDQLKELAASNGKTFLQPLATGFGTAMNSGLYNTAKTHGVLGFDIQLKTGFGLAPANKTSETTYKFDFSSLSDIEIDVDEYSLVLDPDEVFSNTTTPNVVGGKAVIFEEDRTYVEAQLRDAIKAKYPILSDDQVDAIVARDDMQEKIATALDGVNIHSLPGIKSIKALEDAKMIPFPFPILQASIGLPMGIEPSIRIIPKFEIPGDIGEAIGEISAFGAGVKLDIDRWIPVPLFPVDLAAQFYFQKMNIGEYLSANSTAMNLMVSKKLLFLTPYLGIGKESSKFTASYKKDGDKIEFDIDGKNSMRFTAGLNIKIMVLQLNAEYSIGEYNAAGLGVGFALR